MVMMIGSDDGDLVNDQDCLRPEDQDNEVKTSLSDSEIPAPVYVSITGLSC